ncbi:hypothetical protein SAMN05421837_11878 [Amycolatopsis pretoriensis]|uniref:Uncharacterized protein n=1 Tax=Amycolatopsis pretoriensis TaxID=218821 RepID=A0A1H5RKU3_9PSEU|nr:hypothetical protein [Amycolatopsis pretoriensis]SEF38127.1 hypothetical protein SAMN05421837_11878 [Amycolatopsis pretoriensis]
MNRPATDTTHAAPRLPVTVDAYDFRQLSHDHRLWAGHQSRDDHRFEAMTGDDVDYSWPHAWWYPDWLTVIVARSFLDATGHRYQIISDLDDPLAESAAHTLWRPCPEHRCGRCAVAPICSYVILTAYPGEPPLPQRDSATGGRGEAPPPTGSC